MNRTAEQDYAERLERLGAPLWKRFLNVQLPYRWNLQRLRPGRTLDVGCGVGRNLESLDRTSVGVDHNSKCVEIARLRGFTAYTSEDFLSSSQRHGSFDSLLLSHVLEHMPRGDAQRLLNTYRPYLRSGGTVIMITPQEAGFKTDPTHVRFVDFATLREHAESCNITIKRSFSFPFPRWVGKLFPYNEFICVGSCSEA